MKISSKAGATRKKKRNETKHVQNETIDPDDKSQSSSSIDGFDAAFKAAATTRPIKQKTEQPLSAHTPAKKEKNEQTERDKTTVCNLRKANSMWDKTRRDYNALVLKSKAHENTIGCKFEKDLEVIIEEGTQLDVKIQNLESKYLRDEPFTNAEIIDGATWSQQLMDLMKNSGNKKAAALRPWFKVE